MSPVRPTSPAIELSALTRTFRGGRHATTTALDGVDLEVPQGQVLGLLGENGAGKTTLAKILSTLLLPTSGTARVLGHDVARDVRAVRDVVTAVFGGDRGLYPMLSGRENLRYFGAVHAVPHRELRRRMPELLDAAGLAEAADRRVETYSKGMRQRLHVCIGLLTRPRVLLLDEPTVGLDPAESARLRDVIAEFPAQGSTVVLTSHNLLDVEQLAQRVVVLRRGRLTHDLTVDGFRRLAGYEAVVSVLLAPERGDAGEAAPGLATGPALSPALTALGARLEPAEGGSTRLTVAVERWSADVLGVLAAELSARDILDVQVRPATLDDAFARAMAAPPGTDPGTDPAHGADA